MAFENHRGLAHRIAASQVKGLSGVGADFEFEVLSSGLIVDWTNSPGLNAHLRWDGSVTVQHHTALSFGEQHFDGESARLVLAGKDPLPTIGHELAAVPEESNATLAYRGDDVKGGMVCCQRRRESSTSVLRLASAGEAIIDIHRAAEPEFGGRKPDLSRGHLRPHAGKHIDVIDVCDWHFIPAAVTLKNALGIPFVYSVDSLEDHRSPGANAPFNMAIRGIEWLGFFEAQKVTAKSEWMQAEIVRLYKVPKEKITVLSIAAEARVKDVLEVYKAVSGGVNA